MYCGQDQQFAVSRGAAGNALFVKPRAKACIVVGSTEKFLILFLRSCNCWWGLILLLSPHST